MDGLYDSVEKMSWRSNLYLMQKSKRYIVHIADAPPHGDIYSEPGANILNRSFVWT